MKKTLLVVPVLVAFLAACSGLSDTQQRTLSGGAIGAAAGAGITALAGGNAIWGAVGGAVVGAVGGYGYDLYDKKKQQEYNKGYQAGKKSAGNNKAANATGGAATTSAP